MEQIQLKKTYLWKHAYLPNQIEFKLLSATIVYDFTISISRRKASLTRVHSYLGTTIQRSFRGKIPYGCTAGSEQKQILENNNTELSTIPTTIRCKMAI